MLAVIVQIIDDFLFGFEVENGFLEPYNTLSKYQKKLDKIILVSCVPYQKYFSTAERYKKMLMCIRLECRRNLLLDKIEFFLRSLLEKIIQLKKTKVKPWRIFLGGFLKTIKSYSEVAPFLLQNP